MVSILFNKQTYKLSLHDIMENYNKMFRDKNQGNKGEFFNTLDNPEHSDHNKEFFRSDDLLDWTKLIFEW